jgi:hypothetical protein
MTDSISEKRSLTTLMIDSFSGLWLVDLMSPPVSLK